MNAAIHCIMEFNQYLYQFRQNRGHWRNGYGRFQMLKSIISLKIVCVFSDTNWELQKNSVDAIQVNQLIKQSKGTSLVTLGGVLEKK